MILDALIAALLIALVSLTGVFFFGDNKRLIGAQRYIIPVAVGVFLSLILFEMIPETLASSPNWGGITIGLGFIAFYILANVLHKKFHDQDAENCDQKGAAILLLIGDAIHNVADGIILGSAFLINPTIGFAAAIGIALHELPQEIVEFGVLIRAGYSRTRAALYNLISASSIFIGTILIIIAAEYGEQYIWIFTGLAAGNLLYIAASDLLPRIHGGVERYGNIWNSALSIILGFTIMTGILTWTHENFGHGDAHHHDTANISEEYTHIDEH
ncbi:MAG: hypothetical protein COV34_02415 [Candidatus Zambryskibacteria bacterium CG10_big_fil_rev_8_21_14_0_10_42_12]|uniref:ZIP zinc transporter n=1 Tax=Candidatus Zambryskibacteria bacterium CG10_big_fil_rev_8_21_14_0_10_42_12 TaxID=1975115 RepID=A0A2H0QUG0_9BACT|nr:MAG: hypothetical protein COV34_02415 [Candidatus Zambryskibacteria bacterium CG10_big_fil_rev_8_21_14_0_10_42_12]